MTALDMVREFHVAMGAPVGDVRKPDVSTRQGLRLGLIDEERDELVVALANGDVVEVADALADLIYVVTGAAVEWGIPLDEVLAEVHRSNMSKIGGTQRADGKILKPATYQPPQIERVMTLAAARAIGHQAGSNGASAPCVCGWCMRCQERTGMPLYDEPTTHVVGGRVEVTVTIGSASGTRVGKVTALDQVAVDLGDGHARAYPPSAVRSL